MEDKKKRPYVIQKPEDIMMLYIVDRNLLDDFKQWIKNEEYLQPYKENTRPISTGN